MIRRLIQRLARPAPRREPIAKSPMELYGDLSKASPATLALLMSAERAHRKQQHRP